LRGEVEGSIRLCLIVAEAAAVMRARAALLPGVETTLDAMGDDKSGASQAACTAMAMLSPTNAVE